MGTNKRWKPVLLDGLEPPEAESAGEEEERVGEASLGRTLRGYLDRPAPETPSSSPAMRLLDLSAADTDGKGKSSVRFIEESTRPRSMDDDTTDPPGRTWTIDSPDLDQVLGRMAAKLSPPWFDQNLRSDLRQEVLLRLTELSRISTGDQRRFRSSFLWQTVSYVRNEVARREGKRHQKELSLAEADTDRLDGGQDPASQYGRVRLAETGQAIRCCLQQLRYERRVAVTLHLMGFKNHEIAQSLHCRKKSAENRVYRGLEQLRACLVEQGVEQ